MLKNRVFPPEKTYKDAALYSRIKVLEWITYDHLEIKPQYRVSQMWEYASDGKNI